MEREKFVEEIVIDKRTVRLVHEDVPVEQVVLDEDNPRIRYRLKIEAPDKRPEDVILTWKEVKDLRKDIEKTGGLRERIIVQTNGDGTWKVREGNCRTVCYRSLHEKNPKEARWKKIPAKVLPKEVGEKEVAILLSDFHVAGKITWNAHEKAGQIYHMAVDLSMDHGDIAMYLRTSKATVQRYLDAYKFMVERFLKIDNGKYGGQGEGKWSFFDEFFKRKELRNELKKNPEFGDDFCRWIGEGNIPQPVEVRRLPGILQQAEARKELEKGGTFAEALKVLEIHAPEQTSDFFKLLKSVQDACSGAAQLGELLRVRNDPVAQQKVVDAYKALAGFIRLAGVEPPEV